MIVETLGAQCETAMHLTIGTIFDDDIRTRTIVRVLVSPGALASFQYHCIVIHMHITTMNQHILADIKIDGIRTGTATTRIHWGNILRRSKDETA